MSEPSGPPPWEPPLAGTADEQLLGSLDRLRWTFRWKVDALDSAGLARTVGASTLTLGGLLKHLAIVEDDVVCRRITGAPMPGAWRDHGFENDADWDFHSAASDTPEALYAGWDAAVARSRQWAQEVLASAAGFDARAALSDEVGEFVTARRFVCDLIEEYGRHTGHADLIREALDGRVGEDPPSHWRPVGAHDVPGS